jgi:3-phenylpropionate/trans-cinnamate dioxygenase ferredoxin subunit
VSELVRVALSSVPDGKAVRLEGGPDGVCLVRIGSSLHAVVDRCTHADVRLSEGEVDPEECSVECWKHGSTFSLIDGEPQSLPATRPVQVLRVEVEGDEVVVSDS